MRAHGVAITTDPIRQRAWQAGLDAADALDLEGRTSYYCRNAKARAIWTTFVPAYYRSLTVLRPWDRSLPGREKLALALIDARPPRKPGPGASASEIERLAETLRRARTSGIDGISIRRYAPRRSDGTIPVKQMASVLTYLPT